MPDGHGEDSVHDTLTLRFLLDEALLRQASVEVVDDADLDREIGWCLPWIVAVGGNESLQKVLVHARKDVIGGDSEDVQRTIRGLQKRGAAALAINLAGEPPAGVRAACRKARLPLLILPADTSHMALSRLVAEKNIANAAHVLQYGVTVHHALGEVLYRGAGLGAMARQVARLSNCPVLILDTHLEVLVTDLKGLDDREGVAEEVVAAVRDLIGAGALVTDTAHGKAAPVKVAINSGDVTVVAAPIVLGGTTYGWVLLIECEHPPRRHDLAQHLVIATEAATITGSEMLRLRSVEAAEERARGDFVHALLHARFSTVHEVVARAGHHSFDIDAPYGVVVVSGGVDTSTPAGLERQATLVRGLRRMQSRPGVTALATAVGDLLVVVAPLGPGGAGRDTRTETDALAAFAHHVDEEISKRVGRATLTTFGRPGVGAAGVATSYREARVALGVAARLGLSRPSGYAELRVYAALAELSTSRQALSFAAEVLEPLRTRDESGDSLEKVALAYIEAGGNLNEAARRLHLHRNTMFYKLERVSRLLRLDLRDPDTMFTIWLAHRIDLLASVEADVAAEIGPSPGGAALTVDPAPAVDSATVVGSAIGNGDGPANVPAMPSTAATTHAPKSTP